MRMNNQGKIQRVMSPKKALPGVFKANLRLDLDDKIEEKNEEYIDTESQSDREDS
jgi:hypothetical protein